MAHHRNCDLHENIGVKRCWGILKKGGSCRNGATCPAIPGVLPTCKIHRRQIRESSRCKESLDCGFNCGELLESEIHGFQLCPRHRENLTACYFLDIPVELRCRIYRLLLPNKDIPARFCTSRSLTTYRGHVYAAILGVNHQIHEEASRLLYCTNVFTVEVSEGMLSMCNMPSNYMQYSFEQQVVVQNHVSKAESGLPSARLLEAEPAWNVPISERYFTMIQSFRVEIYFPMPLEPNPHERGIVGLDRYTALKVSHLCDEIHLLVSRLQLRQQPIAHLDISIKLLNTRVGSPMTQTSASLLIPTVEALLNPFRRLCQIDRPRVLSIIVRDSRSYEIDVLRPGMMSREAQGHYDKYLKVWTRDLSSAEASLSFVQVQRGYQRVANLISKIRHLCGNGDRTWGLIELLTNAKIARENVDVERLRDVWDRIGDIWLNYVHEQDIVQSEITELIMTSPVV